MALIRAALLEDWANLNDARDKLGELLRKLIHANTHLPLIKTIRFLAHESNQLSGWDGILECESKLPWIPGGTSVWELGTGSNARQKIRDDFNERREKPLPPGWARRKTTYVAVTVRKLDNLSDLLSELKRSNNPWFDVQILDAHSFEEWIEISPSVEAWLQEQGLGPPATVHTLSKTWKDWREKTRPPISTELILAGRNQNTAELRNHLASPGAPVSIRADSPAEAAAFVYAAIERSEPEFADHFLDRAIVVSQINDAARFRLDSPPQNIILIPPATSESLSLSRYGHTVISAYGNSSLVRSINIELKRPLRSEFANALGRMGIPKEQADIDARACGGSPSIWRIWNLVSLADPGNEIPEWASPERSVLVIPAVLLGGWSERFEGDRNVIELITGKSYEEYRNQLNPFISTDNPLLTKVSDAWVITAPATAFALTVRYITQSHLEALATVAKVVFLEIDPTIDLPDDERPYAALKGVGMKHSTWLRDGLAGALLLISVIGEQLERNGAIPSGGTCQSYVDSIVRELPGLREDWRVLASLRDKLPVLAEAAPVPFVEALECLLQGDPEKLQPILKEGKGFLSPAAFHTGLLWALETLAWEPRFLSRVALILAKLAEIDPGGRLANRPANSLKEILLAWHPGTSASLVQRLQTLDLLLERFDRIGWDLLSSILPKGSDVASPTHEPEWKDFGRSQKERLTNGIVRNTYENYVVRAIRHAKKVPDRWNTLIETCDDVSDESQRLIENGLLEVSEAGLSALDQTTIWESLRRFLNKHRAYAGASWALPEERLKRLESVKGRFDPENVVDEVAWLFNEDFPDLPFAKTNYETERCELDELRTDAVRKVWGSGGTQRIRLLVSKVSHVGLIGFHLLTFVDDRTIVVQLVDEMNRGNDKEQFFSRCLSGSAYEKFGSGWIDLLLSKARDARWSPEQTVNVLLNFSDSHQTFDLLESLGKEVERLYWAGRPRWLRSKENDVIARGIGKFEENGYAIDALIVARQQWKAKDPIVVLRLLDKALAELNDAKVEKLTRESYWIAELFNWLRTHGDIDAREIARREYAYLPLLTDQTRKIDLALHEILAIDPEFFVQVLTDLYKPASKTIDDYARTKDSHLRAKFAWKVLTSWKHPPGVDRRGCVIPGKLKEWVEKTRELAAGSDRGDVADREIGKILFHFPADPDDSVWPHLELRQLLETLRNENIESGIEIEQFNARGVVNKELFEGGVQERMLAQEWRTRGEQLGVRWPRSRAMCERIASQWESDAKEEDERADKRRLRMF